MNNILVQILDGWTGLVKMDWANKYVSYFYGQILPSLVEFNCEKIFSPHIILEAFGYRFKIFSLYVKFMKLKIKLCSDMLFCNTLFEICEYEVGKQVWNTFQNLKPTPN